MIESTVTGHHNHHSNQQGSAEHITPVHLRKTSRFLTKFELAAAVALRANDIISGQFTYGRVLADNTTDDNDTGRGNEKDEASAKRRRIDRTKSRSDNSNDDSDDGTSSSDDPFSLKKNKKNKNINDDDGSAVPRKSASSSFQNTNPMAAIMDQSRAKSMPMTFSDPVMIAKHELVQKKLPFVVKRCIAADLPSSNPAMSGSRSKYVVEVIPLRDLEVDIRSIDLGEWMY